MNRIEAENFIYKSYMKAEKHQDYNLKDSLKRKPELTKDLIRSVCHTPCVVVTGSKGKGSVSGMISRILMTRYKVGLMTSPHILDFCERFKINGKDMTDEEFVYYVKAISQDVEEIDENIPDDVCISPMGIQTYIALNYFNAEYTDFNVFEGGKGAKYDDVNNTLHDYAVINSIFLEHTRELGETLEEIAQDKACVITGEQKCVYVAEQSVEVMEIIRKRAVSLNVDMKVYGIDFFAENIRYSTDGMIFDVVVGDEVYYDIKIPLLGEHQAKNCALAMALCKDVLGEMDMDDIRAKLKEFDWPGRMEILSQEPFIMLDACINKESCSNVKEVLKKLSITNVTAIIGIPDDKDYLGVALEMSDIADTIIMTKSQNPHYVFTEVQCERLMEKGVEARWVENLEEAIEIGKEKGKPIVILGTTSVVAEVKMLEIEKGI